jgi:hypothetical protein
VAFKKPSEFFGKKVEGNNLPVVETDNSLREELSKVQSLSEQVVQLQQELSEKVVKNDLESLVLSQINSMQENFDYLQESFKQSNKKDISKFKKVVSEITSIVSNLVENEIPKHKRQISASEIRISKQIDEFKSDVEERVEKFYDVLREFNDVVQVIDTVSNIENYIQKHHSDLVELKEEVFAEIEKIPVGNIQENLERLEKKIDFIKETYSRIEPEVVAKEIIQEGLLNEPPETKNEDPLTPLDQNFVTLDQLQEHYRLFINRIQQQLSTFGGGGETKLKYLDDIVGISTDPSAYDNKFLKYDHTIGKFIFEAISSGGGSGDYVSVAGIATYASTSGVSTYASISGIATYAQTAGIATSAGTATTATNLSDAANILTGTINKDRITTTNALTVLGDLYVSNNISFGGTTTQLNTEQLNIVDADIVLGIGTTFSPTDNTANHGGIAIASTEGSPLVDLNIVPGETNPSTYKKMMWFKGSTIGAGITDAWLFNYAVGIGSTQVPTGVRLAAGNVKFTEFDLSTVRNINASGIVTGSSFRPSSGFYQSANGTNGFYVFDGTGDVSFQGKIVTNYIRSNTNINPTITVSDLDLQFARNVITSGVTTSTISIPTQLRTRSVAEKTTLINGNTVGLAFTTGGGNVAICTNPSADITLNVTEIPTDSSFDNHSISFSVIVTQAGTARSCTAINLNGVSRTIRWAGGSLANAVSGISTTNGYDIFTFTGINTVGSASTTANYVVLGSVNGGFN